MAASGDSPAVHGSQKRARPLAGGGGEAASRNAAFNDEMTASSGPPSSATVVDGVTVVDPDALDCVMCRLPLKPPIFQCKAGHVRCSLCHEKLKATGSCHMCGGVANSSYTRSRAKERVVEAIRVQCPNAGRGCTTRPAYYDQERHRQTCLHAPCRCPIVDCNFVGSTKALLDHFDDFHGWPCFARSGLARCATYTSRMASTPSSSLTKSKAPLPAGCACSCWMWCARCLAARSPCSSSTHMLPMSTRVRAP
ncbi:E3 ubiquitin-protein ligase SINA-like 10 [Panicum hallii]|uniref:E3 ubiquitin-protein ligase SINA-like 10 n=1 Tax=Panicum hallii TaxID=206008 RepID=UPI000DF4E58E|nr:E3 ubiquitin-protein ligase SINA-like 10 [Panicum hallii]